MSVEGIDFRDEEFEVGIGDEVVVISNGTGVVRRVDIIALHLGITTVGPFATSLGGGSDSGTTNKVGAGALGLG